MKEIILTEPREEYLLSYLAACRENKRANVTGYSLHDPDRFEEWRHIIFRRYEEQRQGKFLHWSHVASTTYWSVLDGEFAGMGNIRHRLNSSLKMHGGHIGYMVRPSLWGKGVGTAQLKLLLEKAALLGVNPALITCNLENRASARVIEKNGGMFVDTVPNRIDGADITTCRYWVGIGTT